MTLRVAVGSMNVKVLDVSGHGMKVAGEHLAIGTRVMVPIPGGEAAAQVVHSAGGQIGLRFEKPISAQDVGAIVNPGSARAQGWTGRYREL